MQPRSGESVPRLASGKDPGVMVGTGFASNDSALSSLRLQASFQNTVAHLPPAGILPPVHSGRLPLRDYHVSSRFFLDKLRQHQPAFFEEHPESQRRQQALLNTARIGAVEDRM